MTLFIVNASIFFSLFLISVNSKQDKCFCHLSGQIDDCFCDIQTLEKFNNEKVYPILHQLVERDFFKYYKVNLFKPCKYFDGDVGSCENEACVVKPCSQEELPEGMRNSNHNEFPVAECDNKQTTNIGDINVTLSNITMDFLDKWDVHDRTTERFCDIDDESSVDMKYFDLVANPERYTGYKGPMATRIWKAIYEENCFVPEIMSRKSNPLFNRVPAGGSRTITSGDMQGMCLEKRVFYRVISGLHTSINTHLCVEYLFEDGWGEQRWEPNLSEFQRRFDPTFAKGEGTARLKNLYFIYLLELRALSKVTSYFEKSKVFLFTGRPKEDEATKNMLLQLLEITKKFPMHFDEGIMFKDKNAKSLKKEFADRFLNVTRIIDCVTCEKCRLWGKLQTRGLGTALKILFSEQRSNGDFNPPFRLLRQDVVSLINAFARLSKSIKSLDVFREMIIHGNKKDEL